MGNRTWRPGWRGGAAAVSGLLLVTGCAGGGSAVEAEDRTLRVVMLGSENETLDYGTAQSYFPWTVIGNMCDSLVETHDGVPTLSLATAIEPNEDATEWTITVREDATFHNGAPVTAADVAASIEYFATSPGFATYYSSVDLAGLTALDEATVVVPLSRPRADFVDTTLTVASIVYQDGDGSAAEPSCGGPFVLDRFDPDTGAVLSRNPDHWGEQPAVAGLEILRVPDPQARLNALISGSADFAVDLPHSATEAISEQRGLQLMPSDTANANALYFVLNTRVAPFDDPEVRRAVAEATDRQQLISVVLGGAGELGNDLFGMGLDGYDASIPQRERDLAEAEAVLAAAGVTELDAVVAELTPGLSNAAEMFAQQLAEVGVQLNLEVLDPGAYFTDLERLSSAHVISMYAQNRSAVAMLEQVFGPENPYGFSGWYPQEFADVVEQTQTAVDPAERQEFLDQVQLLQWEHPPHLVWGYRPTLNAGQAGLSGVRLNLGTPLFREVRLS